MILNGAKRLVGVAVAAVVCAVGVLLAGPAAPVQASVVAGGMAVIHRSFPASPDGYRDFRSSITVTTEPGPGGNTFWAHQWGYARSGEGGYVGLQQRSGSAKYLNFSIWGANGWSATASDAYCRPFGHEGSGVQCDMPYPWVTGVTYQIAVEQVTTTSWRAVITDTRSGTATSVATIALPQSRGGISTLSEWVENFSQGSGALPSCQAVPRATAVFGRPTVNGGTIAATSSSSYTYGTCASIARSVCSSDQACTLLANDPVTATRSTLRNTRSGFCLDLLSGGQTAGLWTCTGNANQVVIPDALLRLAFADRAGLCLSVISGERVGAATCAGISGQQWLPVPRTSAYWNPATGKCLDPLQNAALSAPLRVYDCLGNTFQQWTRQAP
jgi:hypothetical protein